MSNIFPLRSSTPATTTASDRHTPSLLPRRLLWVAAAIVAGALTWAADHALLGHSPQIGVSGSQSVGVTKVVIFTLIVGLLGYGAVAALEHLLGRRKRAWLELALGTMVVSLLGPLTTARGSSALALAAIHLVVGMCLLIGLCPISDPATSTKADLFATVWRRATAGRLPNWRPWGG